MYQSRSLKGIEDPAKIFSSGEGSDSTFLDFQRNYYPCINYNPAQGSLLYSKSREHCQYPVSTSPISISIWIYITWEQSTLPEHLKTSNLFLVIPPNRDLKTSLSLRITSSYVTSIDRDSYHSILTVDQCSRSRFLSRVSPILGWRGSSRRGNQRRARRALRLVSEEGGKKKFWSGGR